MKILKLDIGGANTKAALIEIEKDNIKNSTSYIKEPVSLRRVRRNRRARDQRQPRRFPSVGVSQTSPRRRIRVKLR